MADISTPDGCQTIAAAVREHLGGIDVAVHMVGGSTAPAGGFAGLEVCEWQRTLDVTLFPAVRLDRALVPLTLDQSNGVIVQVTSIQDRLPLPGPTMAYAAAKRALSNYSKALAKEVGPKSVGVVRVAPGWVETDGAIRLIDKLGTKAYSVIDVATVS